MKKYLVLAICCVLLLSVAPLANASVGYQKDGADQGNASKIDIRNGYSTFDGSTLTFFSNGYGDGVTTNVSGETNLTSAALAYGVIVLEDTGALDSSDNRYITLADGTAGQMVTIILEASSDGGVLTITDDYVGTAIKNTGWDDIAFDVAGDSVTLLYVDDTYGWVVVGEYGVTVT